MYIFIIYIFFHCTRSVSFDACLRAPSKSCCSGMMQQRGGLSLHNLWLLVSPENWNLCSGKSSACCRPVITSHLSSFCSFEVGVVARIESSYRSFSSSGSGSNPSVSSLFAKLRCVSAITLHISGGYALALAVRQARPLSSFPPSHSEGLQLGW